jgi:hypothetical protein
MSSREVAIGVADHAGDEGEEGVTLFVGRHGRDFIATG